MKNKLLVVLNYFFIFISSMTLFTLTLLLIFSFTILNSSYVIDKFDKMDYYNKLYKDIKLEMSYYTVQSGFNDDILNNTFAKDDIRDNVVLFLNNFYKGVKTEIDTEEFKTKLYKNIDDYLKTMNYKVSDTDKLDDFVNKMSDIYVYKIKIIDNSDTFSSLFYKILNIKNILQIILIFILLVTLIINKIVCNVKSLDIVFYINSLLLIVINIYIKNKLDINNLYIYNENLSKIFRIIINDILHYFIIIIIVYFILGVFISVLGIKKKKKRIRY